MTSSMERTRRHRKSSDSYSSDSKSRDRSKERKKKKKEKKRRRSRSRSREKEEKSKRKKSRSSKKYSKRKEKRERSKSKSSVIKSESEGQEKYGKYYQQMIPPMDPQMMGQYMYPYMMPRDPRMVRPPIFFPPFGPGPRPPVAIPTKDTQLVDQPTDKIVKDQNFLNSDEKLFESIINSEIHIKTIFDDVQISESYAGTTLFKHLKKILHDPHTNIYDSDRENKKDTLCLNQSDIISYQIDEFLKNKSYNSLTRNIAELSSFRDEILKYKNRNQTEDSAQYNNIIS